MKYDLYTCTVHISIHPTKCMSIVNREVEILNVYGYAYVC